MSGAGVTTSLHLFVVHCRVAKDSVGCFPLKCSSAQAQLTTLNSMDSMDAMESMDCELEADFDKL